jgi:hypothetical protein
MPPTTPQQNPFYPSPFKTGDLKDEWKMVFDHIHEQGRTNADLQARLEAMEQKHGKLAQQVAQGPSTTKIMGIPVTATQPTDGQALKYSAKVGGFIFE